MGRNFKNISDWLRIKPKIHFDRIRVNGVMCNASIIGFGQGLEQNLRKNGIRISYASRFLSNCEETYSTNELEY